MAVGYAGGGQERKGKDQEEEMMGGKRRRRRTGRLLAVTQNTFQPSWGSDSPVDAASLVKNRLRSESSEEGGKKREPSK